MTTPGYNLDEAKKLLVYYMKRLHNASRIPWTQDCYEEVTAIVDLIFSAAVTQSTLIARENNTTMEELNEQ